MDGRDFLLISDQFKDSLVEAECRTSIGRAYYALFTCVVGTLESHGVAFSRSGQDHQRLIDYLGRSKHSKAKQIGQALKDLRVERNNADYTMTVVVPARSSMFVYRKATIAIKDLESINPAELASIAQFIKSIP